MRSQSSHRVIDAGRAANYRHPRAARPADVAFSYWIPSKSISRTLESIDGTSAAAARRGAVGGGSRNR